MILSNLKIIDLGCKTVGIILMMMMMILFYPMPTWFLCYSFLPFFLFLVLTRFLPTSDHFLKLSLYRGIKKLGHCYGYASVKVCDMETPPFMMRCFQQDFTQQ